MENLLRIHYGQQKDLYDLYFITKGDEDPGLKHTGMTYVGSVRHVRMSSICCPVIYYLSGNNTSDIAVS